MNYIWLAAAALFSGALGAMGMGGGGVLIIYLTLVEGMAQHTAQDVYKRQLHMNSQTAFNHLSHTKYKKSP